ncbi:MAG TPA: hypothetical protein VM533_03920 [Fimbriiglobus sp.]|jgi:hypothetical protein|nr:hypothetical protein [Fimbriiglobus sp.]
MALIPCPDCGLPRAAADVEAIVCPVCGRRDPEPELTPVVVEPPVELLPAEPELWSVRNWLLLAAFGIAGVGTLVAMLALAPPDRSTDAPDSVAVASSQLAPLSPTLQAQITGPEPAPAPRFVPEVALTPRPAATLVRVDRPNGVYAVGKLSGGQRLRLVGTARRLTVEGLADGSLLDATGLTVQEVIFLGRVADGSTALVRTDGGVLFRAGIDGRSRVAVEARFVGFVTPTMKGKPGSKIDGGAEVTIAAHGVFFGGAIAGDGTRVDVTLGPPGGLSFAVLDGTARLVYRTRGADDPPPSVSRGTVRGNAVFTRER